MGNSTANKMQEQRIRQTVRTKVSKRPRASIVAQIYQREMSKWHCPAEQKLVLQES